MGSFFRPVAVLCLVIAAPAAGRAGPLWTVSSTFTSADGPGVNYAYVGSGETGVGGSYSLGVEMYGRPGPGGTPVTQTGAATVQVGLFDPVTLNEAYQDPPTWTREFDLTLAITDLATGQVGTLGYTGTFESVLVPYWPPNPVEFALDGPAARSLVVGGTRYDVTLSSVPGVHDSSSGVVWAAVTVHETPEPATVTSAGFGVLAAGWWRARRKRRAPEAVAKPS